MTTPLRQALALAWLEADGFIKRRLFLTLLLVLGTAAFAALAPIALKYAVDGFRRGEGPWPELSALGAVAQLETVAPAVLILIYVGSLWLSRSLGEVRWFFFGTADQRLHRRLSRRLLSHIIDLPLAFHLDRKTGALNQTLVQGLAGYRILTEHAVFTALPVLLEILIIGVVLALVLEVEFLAILALSVAAYIGVFVLGAARIVGPIRQVSTTQVDAYANLTDSILNTETIKAFNAERHVADRYDEALGHSERWWSVFYWRKSENGVLVAAVFALSIGAAMTLAGTRVQQGALSIGDFVLINAYIHILMTSFFSIEYYGHWDTEYRAERIHAYLAQPIIEACLRIPVWVMTHGGVDRGLARKVFRDDLPRDVVGRLSKSTPETYYDDIYLNNVGFIREYLLDGVLVREGVLAHDKLEAALAMTSIQQQVIKFQILFYLGTEAWLRGCMEKLHEKGQG